MDLPAGVHAVTSTGVTFYVQDRDGDPASLDSFTDEENVRQRWWDIKSGEWVLDVGPGFGSYTLPALARGAAVIVMGPPLHDVQCLLKSARLNPGFSARLQYVPWGAWDNIGFLSAETLVFSRDEFAGSFPVCRIDDSSVIKGAPRIDWMKIDVEGAETRVLVGAEEMLWRCRPKIVLENHLFIDPRISYKCMKLLESMEYKLVLEVPYHSVSHSLYLPR